MSRSNSRVVCLFEFDFCHGSWSQWAHSTSTMIYNFVIRLMQRVTQTVQERQRDGAAAAASRAIISLNLLTISCVRLIVAAFACSTFSCVILFPSPISRCDIIRTYVVLCVLQYRSKCHQIFHRLRSADGWIAVPQIRRQRDSLRGSF